MSTEIFLDTPDFNSAWDLANHLAQSFSVEWEGREITFKDGLQDEIERRIFELFQSFNPDSKVYHQMAATLAWIGSSPENRTLLEREIEQLIRLPDGKYVGAGWFKKMGKKIGDSVSKACDAVGDFWEEHKTAIIVGAAVVTAVVIIIVVTASTAGTGTGAVATAGCAALDELCNNGSATPQQKKPSTQQATAQPAQNCSPVAVKDQADTPILQNSVASSNSSNYALNPTLFTLPKENNAIPAPTNSFSSPVPGQLQLDLQPCIATSPFQKAKPENPLLQSSSIGTGIIQSLGLGDASNYQVDPRKPPTIYSPPVIPNHPEGIVIRGPDTFTRTIPIPTENKAPSLIHNGHDSSIAFTEPKSEFNGNTSNIPSAGEIAIALTDPSTSKPSYDKFASKALSGEAFKDFGSQPPYGVLPIIGLSHQGTVHALGGIANSDASTMESGNCLYETLDKEFAIQPHRLHSNNIATGITMVSLEKVSDLHETSAAGFPARAPRLQDVTYVAKEIASVLAEVTLRNSKIQESIDYAVEHFSRLANEIIATGNPNLKQLHVPFSNGGHVCKEALRKLTPEQRDTIVIIPVGTTAIIEDRWAHKVINIIGDKDWPSITCNGGMGKIREKSDGATVVIISQTETQSLVSGHYFIQPEYQNQIKIIIDEEIKGKYEIY